MIGPTLTICTVRAQIRSMMNDMMMCGPVEARASAERNVMVLFPRNLDVYPLSVVPVSYLSPVLFLSESFLTGYERDASFTSCMR
jgi:hypothetical protein